MSACQPRSRDAGQHRQQDWRAVDRRRLEPGRSQAFARETQGTGDDVRAVSAPVQPFNWMWAWLFPAHHTCRHPRTGAFVRYRMHEANVQRAVKYARRHLGICVLPHELRHGYATHCLERGANPRAIQQAMGHASLETTMGYLHTESLSVRSPLEVLEATPAPAISFDYTNRTIFQAPVPSPRQIPRQANAPARRTPPTTSPPPPPRGSPGASGWDADTTRRPRHEPAGPADGCVLGPPRSSASPRTGVSSH